MLRLLCSALVVVILTGCAGFSVDDAFRQPTFDHQSTRLTGLTWTGLTGRSVIELKNPNPYGLPISQFKAQLWLADEPWIDLDSPQVSGLAANGSTAVDIGWSLAAAGLVQRISNAYQAGEAELELRLTPVFDVPVLGPRSFDFAHRFTVPIPQIPRVQLADWRVESVSFTELTLGLDLLIDNPNRFNLATSPIQLDINSGNQRLSRLGLGSLQLDSGESQRRSTEVTLSFADLGMSLVNALRTGAWPENLALDWQGGMSSPDLGLNLPALDGRVSLGN
ncbi:MAG: LEA type 2 family protein [Saccharospirillum sp.]